MTHPEGEAFIKVHADVSSYPREVEEGVRRGTKEAELEADRGGKNVGHEFSTAFRDELGRHGKEFTNSLEKAIEHEHVTVHSEVDFDRDPLKKGAEEAVLNLVDDIKSAFESLGGGGGGGAAGGGKGPFGFIGSAFADAIGSTANVSGKSPLIAVLVPLIGTLIAAIGAAIEAADALVAVLFTIPTALFAVGLEAGALFLVFHGLGQTIKDAFAAQNLTEFNKALEGTEAHVGAFLRTFVPAAKEFFKTLQAYAQANFFAGLGDKVLPQILHILEGPLAQAFGNIARDFGHLLQTVLKFFQDPLFLQFINDIVPAINNWIGALGPAFYEFLTGLTKFGDAMIPLLNKLGTGLVILLLHLGDKLFELAGNKGFQNWLERMLPVLSDVGDLLIAALGFGIAFVNALDQAGGAELITSLTSALNALTGFFSSPIGKEALAGLIDLLKVAIFFTVGLVAAVALLMAGFEQLVHAVDGLGMAIDWLGRHISEAFQKAKETVEGWFNNLVRWSTGIPAMIGNAVGDLKNTLFQAGVNLISGLIAGFRSRWDDAIATIKNFVHEATAWLPGSPAKKGPLSGAGYVYLRGQRMAEDFAAGIGDATTTVSNASSQMVTQIVFGAGAVRVGFEGVVPTEDEARITGSAAGEAMANQLAARNSALAVRTL